MAVNLVLLVGAPRSGTTMLERVLASHAMIQGGPEPHILTPLAHLGIWSNVQKAPYDHIVAALGQKDFVQQLPAKEEDYWAACRAYCEVLYGKYLERTGKSICLDKTPEYATVLPFIEKVLPQAKYVVLTRHPVAVFTSFANSFFGGDFAIANTHDPLMDRYVPALAHFIRRGGVERIHVRYEDFVSDPEGVVERIYRYIGIPHDPSTLDYARESNGRTGGLGDPIGVQQHSRPSTESLTKWTAQLRESPEKLTFVRKLVERLDPEDLRTLGYPLETFWEAMDDPSGRDPAVNGTTDRMAPRSQRWNITRYALERQAIVQGRALVQRSGTLRDVVSTIRIACEVLLREY